jgi:hypothetical protein
MRLWRADFYDDVSARPQAFGVIDDVNPGFTVGFVRKLRCHAGSHFHSNPIAELFQPLGCVRCQRYAPFPRVHFFWHPNRLAHHTNSLAILRLGVGSRCIFIGVFARFRKCGDRKSASTVLKGVDSSWKSAGQAKLTLDLSRSPMTRRPDQIAGIG